MMLKYDIAGHFPFIVGFPDESDASIQATLDCAKKLRSLSPDFLTPIYYFKPYPGSELVIEAVARGFRLPETLEAWAEFDYVAGQPGPWVSPREVRAHRALQVLPRAGLEARVARQAAPAAARALSLRHGQLSMAGRDAVDPLAGAGAEAVMSASQRILLINPTITSHRHARFPLAVMSLSAALEGRYRPTIIDGNVDRDFVSTALRAVDEGRVDCRRRHRHGRAAAAPRRSPSRRRSARDAQHCRSSGAAPSRPSVRTRP